MKDDPGIPKLSRKQKIMLVFIALVVMSMMMLMAMKLALLFDMWSN